MQAITYSRYGPPSVLQVESLPDPEPAQGEVLVAVKAAEATKSDCELRSLQFPVRWVSPIVRLAIGGRRPRRRVLGGYFAGEVIGLGAEATRLRVGDRIFGASRFRFGGYGQRLAVPESYTLAKIPDALTFAQAAAVPLGGLNALHFMRAARIEPGTSALIVGGGGSIGLFAIQIAKRMGARVTAVDHHRKRDLVEDAGADEFVDYTREDFATRGQAFDVVFSTVAGISTRACFGVLREGGRFVNGNPRLAHLLMAPWARWVFRRELFVRFAAEAQGELDDLAGMLAREEIRPFVDSELPMSAAPLAHERVQSEDRLGAIVLRIDG